ncbi:MAG: N-acetyltransferase [Calditrichaeota bacterium]|nr:MAG: N-acetyltransferase [Calditrichota bacterium]
MKAQPTLKTKRLILRPYTLKDSKRVQLLAGDKEIARTTLLIPHPYADGEAEKWISTHKSSFEAKESVTFAIVSKESNLLIGGIGLTLSLNHERAEMGYWLGKEFWNQGFTSEAGKALLDYGFSEFKLNRIDAHHFHNNPSSGKVLQKIGMKYEGRQAQYIKKWGKFLDILMYGILRVDWEKSK